ncbi:hypothetical protein [Clostridium fallax]|uniref:Uncharacterized protein n=1 Tax=Clostridium fallax TaxID=1533 RepID=A0A1M4WN26_9CLOT|nr:hypothetical protein [Clostridium fallax]SHE82587.1 hypothetical protein SAMN05443638_11316 [Clostridium fallax]SQB06238.1 Uncharacterised protein [Clostridium fallax]
MNNTLYQLIPMILALGIGQSIYLLLDKKCQITKKIKIKLSIKQRWQGFFCVCFAMISLLAIGILGIYVIDIEPLIYSVSCGLLIGVSNIMAYKLNTISE